MAEASAIIVKDVKKSYKNNQVLRGVDLEVQQGTVFALLGSNGAGKTTMINILTTLLKADSGSAIVNGHNVATDAEKVRNQIGLTGQFAAVDDMLTGRENLIMFAKLWRQPNPKKVADDLLTAFNLQEAASRAALTYSGGMRRRLDIAMSLIGTPPVIFLDEPTTGLDPQSRNAMWEIIRDLTKKGRTVFLTTQYLEEADQLANRIAILHEGRIATEGTPSQLKSLVAGRSIELKFGNNAALKSAAKLLKNSFDITIDEVETALSVTTNGSATQAMQILNTLQKSDITVDEFSQKQPSLDDVFLSIVDTKNKEQA